MQIIGLGCAVTLTPIFFIDGSLFGASTIFYFILIYQLGVSIEAYQYQAYSQVQKERKNRRIQNSIQLIILWLIILAAL